MLKRISLVCVVAILMGTAAIADRDDDRYGAIAYSRHTGHYGVSDRAESRERAERRALDKCEGRDCKIEVWFRNSCGALATGEDGDIVGWAHDNHLDDAKEHAVRNCRNNGGHRCRVIISACAR
ncbi:MAG TPA: DUF4189 domain-containing protein [Thermoanaerobaculia bacterium]|jgi:hypothetical protein|nr:DUF4189 domain-containing protein [Thermoanaerobaculia bacterium]